MGNMQSCISYLDDFIRGRIIGSLENTRSVTSVAEEFGICHSIYSRAVKAFQMTEIAVLHFTGGHPQATTVRDGRYIIQLTNRGRCQTCEEITRHIEQTTGRSVSLFTIARRMQIGNLLAL